MEKCTIPPAGWVCSREAGHEGPCAAHPSLENIRSKIMMLTDITSDAQAIALALVHLGSERPGWVHYLKGIAEGLGIGTYWESFTNIGQ